MTFVIRTLGHPAAIVPAVRSAVAEVTPDIPLVAVNTVEAVIDGSLDRRRFNATVFGSVAFLAILLSCRRIYSMASYSVSLRQRELGIRLTIGAPRGSTRWRHSARGDVVLASGREAFLTRGRAPRCPLGQLPCLRGRARRGVNPHTVVYRQCAAPTDTPNGQNPIGK